MESSTPETATTFYVDIVLPAIGAFTIALDFVVETNSLNMCVDEDAAHVHGAAMDPSATLVAVTVPVTQMIVTAGSVQAPPSIDPSAVPRAPDKFTVTFATTVAKGANIVIEVVRAWAPLGADRFLALVKDGFYSGAAFFRIVPDFVVQFGIAGNAEANEKWSAQHI